MSPLEKQLAAASQAVEEARRRAHHDPHKLGELIEQMSVLADLRQKEGDFRKADSLYREALFRVQELRKPDPRLLVGIYSLIAHLNDRWGRMDEAARNYEKALDLGEKHGLHDSDEAATIRNNLAVIFKNLRDHARAERYYRESLDSFLKIHGENSPQVASLYNNLGVLYYSSLDVERAQEMHEKALRIRQQLGESEIDPADLAQTYINLAAVSKASGDFQKAEECIERAKKIRSGEGDSKPRPRRSASLLIDSAALAK